MVTTAAALAAPSLPLVSQLERDLTLEELIELRNTLTPEAWAEFKSRLSAADLAQLNAEPNVEVENVGAGSSSDSASAEATDSSEIALATVDEVMSAAPVETTEAAEPAETAVVAATPVSENSPVDTLKSSSAESQPVEVASAADGAPDQAAPAATLPLYTETELVSMGATSGEGELVNASAAAEVKKPTLVAVLPSNSLAAEASTRPYQVKPGDTLWSIASRHGVTLEDLLSHNHRVDAPEALAVGDSLSIPVATAQAETADDEAVALVAPAALDSRSGMATPRTREQIIQDHLARIRQSNSSLIDRDEIAARIREAREQLTRSRSGAELSSAIALEYYSEESAALPAAPEAIASAPETPVADATGGAEPVSESALTVREGAQTDDSQWTVSDAAAAEPQALAAVLPASEAVDAASEAVETRSAPTQLLAAAPLSADAYRVSADLPVGQVVAPNMPMMPGANEFLPEAPDLANGYVWPTRGTLTSGYGWRWGRMHRGVDIAGPVGTPIVAAASGVVVRSGWNSGGYGNLVDIRHSDGSMTRYAHNSRLMVRAGEQVRQGQQIAAMGSTGYSTGPHLHFEIHLPSAGTVNPMAYLPGR
jgi:murein DD-endopeptidase MepM/ murein hydrolase activator NlpD